MKWRGLIRDEGGATAVFVALGAGAIFGAAGLAIDLGRAMSLQSELQHAADAAALAGAAELNGQDGARGRATAAAQGAFGRNIQSYSTDDLGAQVTVQQVTFLKSLDPDSPASNDAEARFVEVQVVPRESAPFLMPIVTRRDDSLTIGARATAGFVQVACKIPPLMICNPFEEPGASTETPFSSFPGQQILLKTHSGPAGGQWAPGTFGLLDTPEGSQSVPKVAHYLAAGYSPGCYAMSLSVRPGQADAVRSAMNTRFDMYENPFFGSGADRKNPAYRPALNVTKGRLPVSGNVCDTEAPADPTQAMGLPRDGCFLNGTCSRFGDGNWNINAYWQVNHGGSPPMGVSTRYQAYRWEIENGIPDPDASTGTTKEQAATLVKSCYSGATPPSDDPDRRVTHFAVVNCDLHDVRGNAEDIPPVAFVEAFLTEPVEEDSSIWLETIRVASPDEESSVMHDVIQLYR